MTCTLVGNQVFQLPLGMWFLPFTILSRHISLYIITCWIKTIKDLVVVEFIFHTDMELWYYHIVDLSSCSRFTYRIATLAVDVVSVYFYSHHLMLLNSLSRNDRIPNWCKTLLFNINKFLLLLCYISANNFFNLRGKSIRLYLTIMTNLRSLCIYNR